MNSAAKLTVKQVRAIRREHAAGASMASLARKYGIKPTPIRFLIKRITWVWVKDEGSP